MGETGKRDREEDRDPIRPRADGPGSGSEEGAWGADEPLTLAIAAELTGLRVEALAGYLRAGLLRSVGRAPGGEPQVRRGDLVALAPSKLERIVRGGPARSNAAPASPGPAVADAAQAGPPHTTAPNGSAATPEASARGDAPAGLGQDDLRGPVLELEREVTRLREELSRRASPQHAAGLPTAQRAAGLQAARVERAAMDWTQSGSVTHGAPRSLARTRQRSAMAPIYGAAALVLGVLVGRWSLGPESLVEAAAPDSVSSVTSAEVVRTYHAPVAPPSASGYRPILTGDARALVSWTGRAVDAIQDAVEALQERVAIGSPGPTASALAASVSARTEAARMALLTPRWTGAVLGGSTATVLQTAAPSPSGKESVGDDELPNVTVPLSLPVGEQPPFENAAACAYGEWTRDVEGRATFGPCFAGTLLPSGEVEGRHRVSEVPCCAHHAFVERMRGASRNEAARTALRAEAKSAASQDVLPPLLRIRAERAATPLLRKALGRWTESGLDGGPPPGDGADHRWTRVAGDSPDGSVRVSLESWVRLREAEPVRRMRCLILLSGGGAGPHGDTLESFRWIQP